MMSNHRVRYKKPTIKMQYEDARRDYLKTLERLNALQRQHDVLQGQYNILQAKFITLKSAHAKLIEAVI